MVIRRQRVPTVRVESRASAALERRRVRHTEEAAPPPIHPVRRVPRNRPGAEEAVQEGQVMRAPNSDDVYGDAIRSQRVQARPMRSGEYLHVSDLIHRCVRARLQPLQGFVQTMRGPKNRMLAWSQR